MRKPKKLTPTRVLGWREWVSLPDLDTPWIKAKVDTGARSSALHAFDLEHFDCDGRNWVRFSIHPWQRTASEAHTVTAPLLERRSVRSSSGRAQDRPVVITPLRIGDEQWDIELTLTRRDEMGFRMLLGREAIRGRFLVDPGRSYLEAKPDKNIRALNRGHGA
jgi:hypothetical protein